MRDELRKDPRDVVDVDVVTARREVAEVEHVRLAQSGTDVGQQVRVGLAGTVDVEQSRRYTDSACSLGPGREQLLPRQLADPVDTDGCRHVGFRVWLVTDRVDIRGRGDDDASDARVSRRAQDVLCALHIDGDGSLWFGVAPRDEVQRGE